MTSSNQANPYLTDIFRTAMNLPDQDDQSATERTPRIVIHGNNNVIALGGRVVIHLGKKEEN